MTTSLTLQQIQKLTGHESPDAVRMALKRAGLRSVGFAVGTSAWPPKKIYDTGQVWQHFAPRILRHAAEDAAAKELCWRTFRQQITAARNASDAGEMFADRLD